MTDPLTETSVEMQESPPDTMPGTDPFEELVSTQKGPRRMTSKDLDSQNLQSFANHDENKENDNIEEANRDSFCNCDNYPEKEACVQKISAMESTQPKDYQPDKKLSKIFEEKRFSVERAVTNDTGVKEPCIKPDLPDIGTEMDIGNPNFKFNSSKINGKSTILNSWSIYPQGIIEVLDKRTRIKKSSFVATLIGPNFLLTAAHNLFDQDGNLFNSNQKIHFVPAINRQNYHLGFIEVVQFYYPQEFNPHQKINNNKDFAILVLERHIHKENGYFGLHACDQNSNTFKIYSYNQEIEETKEKLTEIDRELLEAHSTLPNSIRNCNSQNSNCNFSSDQQVQAENRVENGLLVPVESRIKHDLHVASKVKDNPILPSWLEAIVRRDGDFENTGKHRLPGSSLSSGIFKEAKTNKEWLGKSIASNKENSEAYAIKERIAADIYAYFGVKVPKIELSLQKMTNVGERSDLEGKTCIHTMSELIDGFKTYKESFGDSFKLTDPNPNQEIQLLNGKRIKERGLGEVLAVAVLINDIDVIGANGGNIGYKIVNHPLKGHFAQTIKIDPGAAFDIYSESNSKTIRVALTGTPKETELHIDALPEGTKKEFAKTLHKIAETTEATFRGFFTRKGAHNFVTYYDLTVDKLTKFIMDRKTMMMKEYEDWLDDYQRIQRMGSEKKTNPKKDAEARAKFDEQKAYQEELYYYVDPNVVDRDNPTKQMPFTETIDTYLNFEKDTPAKLMLIIGESGAGKSLALRYLEQRLLDKRRNDKSSPMPIHIDLKKFNKDDVKQSFEITLKEKYHSEHDPNKSRLILLMDGYDEIAGGCQQNLYDIQQLDRYSKNIRIIITCRTQYLTSGYQQLFRPADGEYKELEIQQFNEAQIRRYLRNYSNELEKAGRENYSFEQYQQKIKEFPSLKDLVVNPFILRLVAESLPRLEEYIKSKQVGVNLNKDGAEANTGTEPVIMNRYAIYECFMEHWFAKQEMRLAQSSGLSNEWEAIKEFRQFSRNIALILLSRREVEIKIKDDELWEIYFCDSDPEMVKARNGCPLRRFNDHQYSFIHKSFLEYFAANGILDMIVNKDALLPEKIKLSPNMITSDQGVISFFKDVFALDPRLEEECFNRINETKTRFFRNEGDLQGLDPAITGAMAITLLNAINYKFMGSDFTAISIPNANLSHGDFEEANFTNANLSNVNFASSCLKNTIFREANLTGVSFGEWPYLQFEDPIRCISFSGNGKVVAVGMGKSVVLFERDTEPVRIRELKRIQNKSEEAVVNCILNADGTQIVICSKSHAPRVWDITTEVCLQELEGASYEANLFDFSPDGKKIVFSRNSDNSVLIRDCAIGLLTHEFRGHKDRITSCKFTPDGNQILSASNDKTLRIWDVSSGISTHKYKIESIQKKGLNLAGANIKDAVGISDNNLMLLYQRGAHGFNEKEIEKFVENLNDLLGNQNQFNPALNLSQKSINDESAWGIGKYTTWFNLKDLNLSQNYIGDKGAIGLGSNSTWINLRKLNLALNEIKEEGAKGLATNSYWHNLEELDLRNNQIGDDGAQVLSTNTKWVKLKNLFLEQNKVSPVSRVMRFINEECSKLLMNIKDEHLLEFERDEKIEKLQGRFIYEVTKWKDERKEIFADIIKKRETSQLNWEDLRREGFSIADCSENLHLMWMPYIKSLDLSRIKVSKEDMISLAENLSLISLEELILSEMVLGNECLNIIANNLKWRHLKKISVQNSNINDDGMTAFVKNLKSDELEDLNLSKNKISDAGAKTIGGNMILKRLKKVQLQNNNISYDGVINLVKDSILDNVEVLNLSGNRIGNEGANAIGGSTSWKNLKELYLSESSIGLEGALSLTRNSFWKNLEVLNLSNNRIDDESGVLIGENKTWRNLIELNLANNLIGDKSARAIGSNSQWKKIKKLDLSVNEIGEEGGKSILMNQFWKHLEELNLFDNSIKNKAVLVIGKNSAWINLNQLLIGKNKLGGGEEFGIELNSAWSKLEKLDLRQNSLGKKDIAKLSNHDKWKNFKVLLVPINNIGDEGAKYLSRNTTWAYLQTLDLRKNDIGDRGVKYLNMNTTWTRLQTLDLSGNKVGYKGAEYLGKNTIWTQLQTLDLSDNQISKEGAENLSKNASWIHLKTLDLRRNDIGEYGTEHLSNNTSWTQLQSLHLSENKIDHKGAGCLGRNTTWTQLQTLDLSDNQISKEGAENLSNNTSWTHLQTLNLSGNKVGEKGVEYLSKNKTWTYLSTLDLSYNEIIEEGAKNLSNNTSWTYLQTLNLSGNKVGEKGAQYLSNNATWTHLQTLNLSGNIIGEKGAEYLTKNTIWTNLLILK